jgi:hypothetical protein
VATALAGDFNGDGRLDVAARMQAEGAEYLAAAFARLSDFDPHEVARLATPFSGELTVSGRGEQYRSSAGEGHFATDTLVLVRCDGGRTAYFWRGSAFEPVELSGAGS